MSSQVTEEQRAAALAWLTTPVRCPRRCPDCHGSGCGITPEDCLELFTVPAGLGLAVAVVREELEREYKEYLAQLKSAAAVPEANTEGTMTERLPPSDGPDSRTAASAESEICEWLGTEVPCEPDCAGGCEGAGCGYTRWDRVGFLKDVPPAVAAYLEKKRAEDDAYEREREEEYEAWKEQYMEEREGMW